MALVSSRSSAVGDQSSGADVVERAPVDTLVIGGGIAGMQVARDLADRTPAPTAAATGTITPAPPSGSPFCGISPRNHPRWCMP
jgi:hypothetical protein